VVDLPAVSVYPTAMTSIVFIAYDGTRYDIDAPNGSSVMENAVRNDIPGIDADCGGACACATCHVYVEEAFLSRLPEMQAMEEDMLDFAVDVRANSRLSCQIRVNPDLDGLTVRVPERQP